MANRTHDFDSPFTDMGGAGLEQLTMAEKKELQGKVLRFRNAERIQQTLLTPIEKKVLLWFAARMPAFINSDHLTALGFVAQLLVGFSYALCRFNPAWLGAATLFLAINWFGDSLDGTLARFRNQQRPRYGFYVDHIIDTFGAMFLCIGLAISGFMSPWIAMTVLIAFLAISIEVYLAAYCLGEFKLGHFGFGPTELRILLAIGNVALWCKPRVHFMGGVHPLFDIGGICAAIGMFVMLVVGTVSHTVTLYREEKLS